MGGIPNVEWLFQMVTFKEINFNFSSLASITFPIEKDLVSFEIERLLSLRNAS